MEKRRDRLLTPEDFNGLNTEVVGFFSSCLNESASYDKQHSSTSSLSSNSFEKNFSNLCMEDENISYFSLLNDSSHRNYLSYFNGRGCMNNDHTNTHNSSRPISAPSIINSDLSALNSIQLSNESTSLNRINSDLSALNSIQLSNESTSLNRINSDLSALNSFQLTSELTSFSRINSDSSAFNSFPLANKSTSSLSNSKSNSLPTQPKEISFNSKTKLLTPENFLISHESSASGGFPNVPDISHEALSAINTKNDFTDVQNATSLPEAKSFQPFRRKTLDSIGACTEDNLKECDNSKIDRSFYSNGKICTKGRIPIPENFISLPSAKRKLNFECPPAPHFNLGNGDIGEEERKYPEFQCSLKISDNIYRELSIENKESKESSLSFKKNPFPPIGVFWDIENCRVPKGMSATHIVQAIRNRFFVGYKEAEFICVCDTLKENPKVLEELNDAQVNILHVGSIVKNAADDKLLQSMRRFADIHGSGASLILISGDSDFAIELYDLRYRKKMHVILVHNAHTQDSLKLSAHETALFTDVTQQLPQRLYRPTKNCTLSKDILVWNLPLGVDLTFIRKRLNVLSSNCGGKVILVLRNFAKISFDTPELAARAKRRIDGEDVYGNRVNCTFEKYDRDQSIKSRQSDPYLGSRSFVRESDRREDNQLPFHQLGKSWREEIPMDFQSNKNLWGKSSGSSSGNLYENCCNLWRVQSPSPVANGHSFGSSSGMNSSSQSSSRENSPIYLHKNDLHRFPYRANLSNLAMNNGYRSQSSDSLQMSGPWSENDTWNSNQYSEQPQGFSSATVDSSQEGQTPVELLITNLAQNIDSREMKKILFSWFRELVMVLHVSVFVQSDGYLVATVTVPSQHDAQYAISQLHRKRIGTKRIIISYITHSSQPPELKRSKVLTLLKEVPGRKLPLFKFRELYERRYQETIGVSEMYNMRDLIAVSDNANGRMVFLNSEFGSLHSLVGNCSLQDPDELRYCKHHSKGPDKSVGWAERDHSAILPNVNLSLKAVSNAVQILLKSHSGSVPLASFVDCYNEEVGVLAEDPEGVPLEHLISCLSGVCIVIGPGGFKHVKWNNSKTSHDPEDLTRFVSPPLVAHLSLFSRELVDLLKTFPHCRMLLSRFIPAYHHHFGRQCRVADYGHTKLADLLVSLPHLIQIMGEGSKRTLTLAHRVQVKRFSSDLLRVLKGQPSKMISVDAFPEAFEKTIGKPWNVTDYGVCEIMDLLKAIQETTIVLKDTDEGTIISIPKREQTAEEIEKTKLFATEVIELLKHSPQCKMQFNRFIPAYHHHFGRQCRVSDYGFSKLIELFEAIPEVLQFVGEDEEGEKTLQLVEKERLRILGDQIFTLVKNSPKQVIGVSALSTVFMHYYGYSLKPYHYDCEDFVELIGKLRNYVKIEEKDNESKVTLIDRSIVNELWAKSRKILWDEPKCSLPVKKFVERFTQEYNHPPNLEVIGKDLQEFLQVQRDGDSGEISLVPVQVFARDLLILLNEAGGRMLLINFESSYLNRFGVACRPANLGFHNLTALVQSLGDLASIKGRKAKRIIVLNREQVPELPSYCPPVQVQNQTDAKEKSKISSSTYNPVPPPPLSFPPNKVPPPPSPPPPTPPCEQKHYNKDLPGSHLIMGLTPPQQTMGLTPPQQTYQAPSPVIYSGSPVAPNGSVVWGQVWSPQYSVIPPLSSTHYMMPTVPINWSSMPSPPLFTQSKSNDNVHRGKAPVSIKTLEQFGKLGVPPNPSELPSPELLTNNKELGEGSFNFEEKAISTLNACEDEENQNLVKAYAKKRLAAHFDSRE